MKTTHLSSIAFQTNPPLETHWHPPPNLTARCTQKPHMRSSLIHNHIINKMVHWSHELKRVRLVTHALGSACLQVMAHLTGSCGGQFFFQGATHGNGITDGYAHAYLEFTQTIAKNFVTHIKKATDNQRDHSWRLEPKSPIWVRTSHIPHC